MSTEREARPTVSSRVLGWSVSISFVTGLSIFHVFALLEFGSDGPLYLGGPFVVAPLCVGACAAAVSERGLPIGSRVGLAIGTAVVSLAAVSVGALVYLALRAALT